MDRGLGHTSSAISRALEGVIRLSGGQLDSDTDFAREDLLSRVRWQLLLRWLATAAALVAVLLGDLLLPGVLPTARLVAILALLAGCNLAIMVLLPRLERPGSGLDPALVVKGQIGLDLLVYTVVLHCSGGAENPAAIYYVLQVIIAAMLLSRRWAFLVAGASSLLYAVVLGLEYAAVIPHVRLEGIADPGLHQRPALLVLLVAVQTSALFLTAYLASAIVQRLRRRERELYQSNLACELRSEDLAAANRRLSEMTAARDTFLRHVTHELRAPVAAIQSYLRLLREGYIPPERLPEVAARAEKRAEEVLALIADLLDLGQVEHDRAQQERERLDLAESITEAVDMLRPTAVSKQLSLSLHVYESTPVVFVNPRHMSLLWNNLIGNAIKYTPPGGRIEVDLRSEGDHLCLTVADTGIGIAPEERDKIFQEFYRSEAARRFDPQGTGIGLAIVQRVVSMYGVEIEVKSVEGKGSTFRVRLPLEQLRASCRLPVTGPRPRRGLPRTLV